MNARRAALIATTTIFMLSTACSGGDNNDDTGGADASIAAEGCGDGEVTAPEVCDDGNQVGGDGCSADCRSDESCGNGVVDIATDEQCDDGNQVDGDGCAADCTAPATALRLTSLVVREPHVYLGACTDVTDMEIFGFSVNKAIADAIADGGLDVLLITRPFAAGTAGTAQVSADAECSDGEGGLTCSVGNIAASVPFVSRTSGDPCLAPDAAHVNSAYTGANAAATPCLATDPLSLSIPISGFDLPLEGVRVGGTYGAGAVAELQNGLLVGVLSEESAKATTIPEDVPVIGGDSLWQHLAGGAADSGCANVDDRDMIEIDGVPTSAFVFYLDFTASEVPLAPGS